MRREAEQSEKNMVVQLREAEEETEAAKIRVDKLESVIEEMAAEVREAQTAKESAKCSFEFKIKELLQQASEEREKRIVDIEKVKELEKYLLKVENELK